MRLEALQHLSSNIDHLVSTPDLSCTQRLKVQSANLHPLDLLQANGIAPRPIPPAEATEDVGHGAEVSLENSESSILEHGTSNVKQEDDDDEGGDDDKEIIRMWALLVSVLLLPRWLLARVRISAHSTFLFRLSSRTPGTKNAPEKRSVGPQIR